MPVALKLNWERNPSPNAKWEWETEHDGKRIGVYYAERGQTPEWCWGYIGPSIVKGEEFGFRSADTAKLAAEHAQGLHGPLNN